MLKVGIGDYVLLQLIMYIAYMKEATIKLAKKLYLEGESLTKLKKRLHVDGGTLSKALKAIGVKIVNYQNMLRFEDRVFDVIDSEAKAYWLGFLFADGSLSKKDNSFELSLKRSDVGHVRKFKKFVKCINPVYVDSFRARIQMKSAHFKERLIELGCTPKKSLTLKFPTGINYGLIRHFIRGYVDGDGHLGTRQQSNRDYPKGEILGTKQFLGNLQKIFGTKKKLHGDKRWKGNTYRLMIQGAEYVEILKFLYEGATVYLDRKYKSYLRVRKYKQVRKFTKPRNHITYEQLCTRFAAINA